MHKVPFELVELVTAQIQELEDQALRHNSTGEETFIQCMLCGEWESHTPECLLTKMYSFTMLETE